MRNGSAATAPLVNINTGEHRHGHTNRMHELGRGGLGRDMGKGPRQERAHVTPETVVACPRCGFEFKVGKSLR